MTQCDSHIAQSLQHEGQMEISASAQRSARPWAMRRLSNRRWTWASWSAMGSASSNEGPFHLPAQGKVAWEHLGDNGDGGWAL